MGGTKMIRYRIKVVKEVNSIGESIYIYYPQRQNWFGLWVALPSPDSIAGFRSLELAKEAITNYHRVHYVQPERAKNNKKAEPRFVHYYFEEDSLEEIDFSKQDDLFVS